jgi:hypothetical protein
MTSMKPGPLFCPNCERWVTSAHVYRSGKTRCRNRLTWTRARLWKLMEGLERGWTDERIGRSLGATANAVNLARKRHGIPARSATLLTARAMADALGIGCSKTVARWIGRGWLRGTRGPYQGPHRQWLVRRDDLYAFLENAEHWHRYDPERIPDAALRRWATEVRGGVRFLTLTEVAWRCYAQPQTVHSWIAKGFLPAVRTGDGNGNHLIREADLDAFTLPRIGGARREAA